mmetsp:Transcript_9832/g.16419  ORF Transcript_9832/g.16419 Transcript_9832/m.16419 type:complete len:220 (-) Transcript_9832:17-676(-)
MQLATAIMAVISQRRARLFMMHICLQHLGDFGSGRLSSMCPTKMVGRSQWAMQTAPELVRESGSVNSGPFTMLRLSATRSPLASAVNGTNCNGDFGCFSPMTGNLARDPLWLSRGGVTYEKMQQVAYRLADEGSVYDERFDVGTQGCVGQHHCQFTTLGAAEAFCDAMPTCKGVMEHPTTGKKYCGGGFGCFTPAKGSYVFDQLWFVTEGKTYVRQFVR